MKLTCALPWAHIHNIITIDTIVQGYSIILRKGPVTNVKIFRGSVTPIKSCKCDMPWIFMLAKPQINFRNVGIPTALRGTLSICLMTKSRCLYYNMWCTNIRLKKSLKSVNVLQSRSQNNPATIILIFVKIRASTKSVLATL